MITLSLSSIFTFLAIGLLEGFVIGFFIKKEGISLYGNLIWGGIAAIVNGYIGLSLGFSDGVFFAFQGTLAFLFLVNVFHQHHEEDILLYPDTNAAIIHKLTFKNR